jgi:predicted transcriptional regulator
VKVDKISISFDPELGDQVRSSAKRSGRGLSGWLADAAAEKLRREAFDDFLAAWEAEHGAISPEELAEARHRLGPTVLSTP